MNNKKVFSLFAAAALTLAVSAQQSVHDNYIGVSFGGGLNSMLYKPANGTQSLGGGFDAGIFYGRFFNKTVGLGVGLQYSWANAYATYNWNEVTTGLTHPNNPNTPYNLTTGFDNFVELQNVGYLSIPVEVLFRKPLSDRAAFIAGIGLSLDLPLHAKYSAKKGSYSTSGVFPELGTYSIVDMPEHGFSTYTTTQDAKINNRAKVGGSAIADLGFRVALNDNWGMYFGLYAGYGFTNLIKEAKTEEMIMINSADPSKIDYRGTFDSNETGKVNLLRAGVKIAIDFGWPVVERTSDVAERIAREMATRDNIAAAEAELARLNAEVENARKAAEEEKARLNALKAEADSIAAKQAQTNDLDAEKAAREKAEADRLAEEKARLDAERARIAALKAKGETVSVHFESAGATVKFREDEKAILDEICHLMAHDASVRIVITGHTDNIGDPEKNLRYFGMKRAEALRDYMVSQGVPADQIRCLSKGQTEPVASNDTREGRALNRRANIRFE